LNALNPARFRQPDGNLIDKTFGQIQTAADPRIVQFGLKVVF